MISSTKKGYDMLTISLEIHGDGTDSLQQAKAVVSTLHGLYGDVVLGGVAATPPKTVLAGTTAISSVRDFTAPSASGQTAAPDGQPMTEPEAAAVFGAQPDPDAHEAPEPAGDADKNGIPWDARIHSEAKGQNKDGTWKRRRNTPDETFNAVMAELQAGKGVAATGAVPPPPTNTPAPPPPPPATAPTNSAAPVPSPAPANAAASSTAPAAPVSGSPFVAIMNRVTAAQRAGTLTPDVAKGFYGAIGIAGIHELASKKDLIPAFGELLESIGA